MDPPRPIPTLAPLTWRPATHRPLLHVALAALAAAGCDGTARTIAGDPSTGGAFHADTWSPRST